MAADVQTLPILYSFRRCPYAMRARMALLLCGQPVRLRELILRDKPEDMLAASPKGTVPVLVLPDGHVIDESLAVMDWAIDQGIGGLAPTSDKERQLIVRNDGPFKHDLDRYKYPNRYEDVDPLDHRSSGASFLSALNNQLADSQHLFGKDAGYVDYAVFPFVRQFRIADPEWFDKQHWPKLHPWLHRLMESDIFRRAMIKFSLWNETGEEHIFASSGA